MFGFAVNFSQIVVRLETTIVYQTREYFQFKQQTKALILMLANFNSELANYFELILDSNLVVEMWI